MPRLRSTKSADTSTQLAAELASARQTYETRKENVLARAQERLAAVQETQRELAEEAVAIDAILKA